VTEGTGLASGDRSLAGAVLARLTHPEEIGKDWTPSHYARRELGLATWARMASA